jgi:hypothetical protein
MKLMLDLNGSRRAQIHSTPTIARDDCQTPGVAVRTVR